LRLAHLFDHLVGELVQSTTSLAAACSVSGALAAGAQSVILLPKRTGRLLHATAERLKKFGSILVAPERRSPEYLQKFIQSEIEK
jgi:hypothetical protein